MKEKNIISYKKTNECDLSILCVLYNKRVNNSHDLEISYFYRIPIILIRN